jgi:hypothetical protein
MVSSLLAFLNHAMVSRADKGDDTEKMKFNKMKRAPTLEFINSVVWRGVGKVGSGVNGSLIRRYLR